MRKLLAIGLFLLPMTLWAQNDFVPKSCDNVTNPASLELCEFAKKYQLPYYRTSAIYLATIVEVTAQKCEFRLTKQFYEGRTKVLQGDEKFMNVYATFLKWNDEHFKQPNLKEFCKRSYETLGPETPKGKQGQLFE